MKPKIICHMISSVDGRLLNTRWTLPYGGKTSVEIGKVYAEVGIWGCQTSLQVSFILNQ